MHDVCQRTGPFDEHTNELARHAKVSAKHIRPNSWKYVVTCVGGIKKRLSTRYVTCNSDAEARRNDAYLTVLEQRRLVAGGFCEVAEHGACRVHTRTVRPGTLSID